VAAAGPPSSFGRSGRPEVAQDDGRHPAGCRASAAGEPEGAEADNRGSRSRLVSLSVFSVLSVRKVRGISLTELTEITETGKRGRRGVSRRPLAWRNVVPPAGRATSPRARSAPGAAAGRPPPSDGAGDPRSPRMSAGIRQAVVRWRPASRKAQRPTTAAAAPGLVSLSVCSVLSVRNSPGDFLSRSSRGSRRGAKKAEGAGLPHDKPGPRFRPKRRPGSVPHPPPRRPFRSLSRQHHLYFFPLPQGHGE
jgi:hypothetical protein